MLLQQREGITELLNLGVIPYTYKIHECIVPSTRKIYWLLFLVIKRLLIGSVRGIPWVYRGRLSRVDIRQIRQDV